MDQAILIGIWFFVFVFVVALTYKLRTLKEHKQFANIAEDVELLSTVQNVVYAILVVVSLIGVAILFFIFKRYIV
jgi:Na+/H+ antiporter NhaC